jgi:hypothetical protein
VGRSSDLRSTEGVWRNLVVDAEVRGVSKCLDGKLFREAVKKLELNDVDSCIDKCASQKEIPCKVSFDLYV